MRLKPALAAAVAALVLASVVVANAAQLSLEGPSRMSAQSTVRCDDTVATTTTGSTSTSVTISGIAAACAGRSLTVRSYLTSEVLESAAATVPSGGGSMTVIVPLYTPSGAHKTYVSIGGWPVPSTWSFLAPSSTCTALRVDGSPQPGGTCVVTGITMAAPWGSPRQTNGHVAVTSSSPYLSFSVDLRPALPSNWNWSTSGTRSSNNGHALAPGTRCSALPSYSGTTNREWSTVDIYIEVHENRSGLTGLNCVP